MESAPERREHPRFLTEHSVFVVFRPEFKKIGPILDVSEGGLRFTYLPPSRDDGHPPDTSQLVDIFVSDNSFHLSNIPCKLIYDMTEDAEQLPFRAEPLGRHCGLQFEQLTEEQQDQIKYLLETHTVGSA